MPPEKPLTPETAAAAAKTFKKGTILPAGAEEELHSREMERRKLHQQFLAQLKASLND